MKYITTYLATLVAFGTLDALWIGVIAKSLYKSALGGLMRPDPVWWAAILFYVLYIIGLIIFAIVPGARMPANGIWYALLFGALFGFFCYMTYDLTNAAVAAGWPMKITFIDIAWGAFASATAALVGYCIYRLF